ncbi:ATP-binding protein [Streptomyces sp. NBC_00344]|uniref:ATP-binding protein n=1 Tax=Streptomyces sp. NBC_00344 TaxID=2975720 RepID=UPI002E21E1FF
MNAQRVDDGKGASGGGAPDGAELRAPVPVSAAAARLQVAEMLHRRFGGSAGTALGDGVLADALLVTSELVTNAFRHGGGLTGFIAECGPDGLRLVVADASSDPPATTPRPAGQFIGGYGWPLVCRLAKSVAVTPTGTGKRVEAILPLE